MKSLALGLCLIFFVGSSAYAQQANRSTTSDTTMFEGLRTTIYVVNDLDRAKAWYAEILGYAPYFDEPFYVGFNVGGYELGLMPSESDSKPGVGGTIVYWGVQEVEVTLARLVEAGASVRDPVQDVGEG